MSEPSSDPLAGAHRRTIPTLRLATPAAVDVFIRILTHGPISRVDITRQTGLSQAAVTKAVAPLIAAGFVTDAVPARAADAAPGRPAQPLRVVPEAMLALGVKINADEIIGVAATMRMAVLHAVHRPLADHGVTTVVDQITDVVAELLRELGPDAERVVGVGVSASGDVDPTHGVVRRSPLLGWAGVPLGELLETRLRRPVLVDNDVRALTIAEEWFGVGVGVESFAIVTIGAGIGCGLYLNGDVVSGARGVAGEIGHLPLGPHDRTCRCGRHGCVETVASSGAILAAVRDGRGEPELTFAEAAELARDGDPIAADAFGRAGTILGKAIASMVNLVGPELVLVMGESASDYDVYEKPLRECLAEWAFGAAAGCRVITRKHSMDAWARGAAASVIRSVVRQEFPGRR
ncbi:MAG TPA: ROK family transcriptional regulator [Rugosimonospora sp.]